MGHYTNYAFVLNRLGLEFLRDILASQIPDGTEDDDVSTVLGVYIETQIAKIDAQIDSACVGQLAVPIEATNPSFAMLEGIAEALIKRWIASHTQHDDIPSKIENEYVTAIRMLGQLARKELLLNQDAQTAPTDDAESILVSAPETTPFHVDLDTAW